MASWLDELKRKAAGTLGKAVDVVGQKVGNILPDWNLSESLESYGGGPKDSPFVWVKPAYAANNNTSSSGVTGSWDPNPNLKTTPSGGYTGSTGTFNTDNDANTLRDLAGNEQQSAVQAILSHLQMMRDIANRNMGEARGVRDEIKSNIGTTYGSLRDTASTQLNAALDRLRQEGIDVQNLYGRAGGDSRRAFESALTRNRMLNRAQGTLGSSFYTDAQTDTTNRAASAQDDIRTEEAGKQAGIATRTTETDNWFKQKAVEIDQEEASLLGQADSEYQKQVNAAMDMERSYGIDSEEQLRNAENDYASKLQGIKDYIQNKQLTLASIGQKASGIGSAISGYDWSGGGLGETLANTSGLDRAKSITSNMINSFQPGVSNIYSLDQLGPRTNTYEEELRRLGLLRNVG